MYSCRSRRPLISLDVFFYAISVENITYDCFDTTMRKQTQIT